MNYTGRVPIIKDYLGREGSQFIEALTQAEEEACKMVEGIFETLNSTFRPQYYKTV